MSKPKPLPDMRRPNRRWGDVIRALLCCPWCGPDGFGMPLKPLRVVAYRTSSWRLECPLCGLRFSLDFDSWIEACKNGMRQRDAEGRPDFKSALGLVILNRDEE